MRKTHEIQFSFLELGPSRAEILYLNLGLDTLAWLPASTGGLAGASGLAGAPGRHTSGLGPRSSGDSMAGLKFFK